MSIRFWLRHSATPVTEQKPFGTSMHGPRRLQRHPPKGKHRERHVKRMQRLFVVRQQAILLGFTSHVCTEFMDLLPVRLRWPVGKQASRSRYLSYLNGWCPEHPPAHVVPCRQTREFQPDRSSQKAKACCRADAESLPLGLLLYATGGAGSSSLGWPRLLSKEPVAFL